VPRISIVIPCYNEAETLEALIDAVLASPVPDKEIVVVDDASTDGTDKVLSSAIEPRVAMQDADLEYDPRDYPRLLQPILENRADVVYGSRFSGGESHRVLYFWHWVTNKMLTLLSNMLTDLNLTDMETCYKAFRREILEQIRIEEDRFGFEPEITAKVAKLGCRIYEVGISYSGRTYAEGKKIGWRDGVRAVWCILKYNLLR
jgi:glycosyltransferase involved in cell wall biosynthesis